MPVAPPPVLQIKRGNATLGSGSVPALRPGEPAFSSNYFDLFVGFNTSVSGNKFFGSHRYWGRENGTTSLRLRLVDKTGTNGAIELKSPDTHNVVTTYTFPPTPIDGYFLKVDANGVLSWNAINSGGSFENSLLSGSTTITGILNNQANTSNSGITTFTNVTNNTLGNTNTGAVQIDGGLGVDKNVSIGGSFRVQGQSEFAGIVTFSGSNVTVNGNLYVNGTTTQVNTNEVSIYDRTITLGIQSGTTPVTTTWDLGVLMNYGDSGIGKTAGVIWESTSERFKFAANSDNPASTSISTPNITVFTFAPIEVSSLWINGCGSLDPLEVIKCNTTEVILQDITIDAGTF